MKDTRYFFDLFVFSVSGTLLLCIPFVEEQDLVNGLVMGRVWWLHVCMMILAGGVGLSLLTKEDLRMPFRAIDGIVVLMAVWVMLCYQWRLDPEPEKLLFGGQLIVLWFMLRYILGRYPQLRMFYLSIILCMGALEAFRGLGQLYGWQSSNHPLFKITGTFFNPGPLAGYMAMILPICLGLILRIGRYNRIAWWQGIKIIYGLAYVSALLIVILLPSSMSRTAWIAALIGCGWVYGMEKGGWRKAEIYIKAHRKLAGAGLITVCVLGIIGGIAAFHLKKDSANGRLLLWKVTAMAMTEFPVSGQGLGGFPAAYAAQQADYFSSGNASDTEKRVAGCPEYAFNEFLQIGLEEGVFGLFLFVFWLGICMYQGVLKRRYAAVGGMLSLIVFAMASYPLQLPSFWVTLVFLAAICMAGRPARRHHFTRITPKPLLAGLLITLACLSFFFAGKGKKYHEGYRQWRKAQLFYNNKAYAAALDLYQPLYPGLQHKPEFLFEGSQCLSKTDRPEEAIEWLRRAVQLSADPMLYYMMAKNEQTLGECRAAEKHLLYALQILPERIYPYYLLSKLYADPLFYDPDRMEAAADSVLTKEPKVQSTAIREMREEMRKMLKSTK